MRARYPIGILPSGALTRHSFAIAKYIHGKRSPLRQMSSHQVARGPAVHYEGPYLFFWGRELQLPESRLQNWYPSVFKDSNASGEVVRFPTAEHYVMWRKALAMGDKEVANKVLDAATPLEANALGREVKNFDGKKWRDMVDTVAEDACWLKFSQVAECRKALLDTWNKDLVEASPVDRKWGIGFAGDEAVGNEKEWGQNLAGKALMKVRDRLRQDSNPSSSKV